LQTINKQVLSFASFVAFFNLHQLISNSSGKKKQKQKQNKKTLTITIGG
jgi:hypothetical protein